MATQQAKRQPNETVLLFHTIFQLKTFSARHFLPVLYIHFPIFFLALLSDVAISPAFSYARVFYIFFPSLSVLRLTSFYLALVTSLRYCY